VLSRRTGSRDFFIGFWDTLSAMMLFSRVIRKGRDDGGAPADRRSDCTYSVGALSSSSLSSM
jgi:hypothetical protein